jgi:hypothetical protein
MISESCKDSSELRALLALIVNAAQTAEKHLSTPKSKSDANDLELRSSIYYIEAACAQLCSLVARPSDTLVNVSVCFFSRPKLIRSSQNRNLWQSVFWFQQTAYRWLLFLVLWTSMSSSGLVKQDPWYTPRVSGRRPCFRLRASDRCRSKKAQSGLASFSHQTCFSGRSEFPEIYFPPANIAIHVVEADTFSNNHLSSQLLSCNPLASFGLHVCALSLARRCWIVGWLSWTERTNASKPLLSLVTHSMSHY